MAAESKFRVVREIAQIATFLATLYGFWRFAKWIEQYPMLEAILLRGGPE